MTEELKIVVDASKPLSEIRAVAGLLKVYNAAWTLLREGITDPEGGSLYRVNSELKNALQLAFEDQGEIGGLAPFHHPLAIVGAETQVGQFVTASPAYGVYDGSEGDPAALARQARITGVDHGKPIKFGEQAWQQAAIDPAFGHLVADPDGAASRASALMDDGRRFRIVMHILELHEKLHGDEDANLTKGEQEALTRITTTEQRTPDQARTVIDSIIADKLLDNEEDEQ